MSTDSFSVLSRSSTASSKSRSGKSLSEKIRDLGIYLRPVKNCGERITFHYLNIKTEFYHPSHVLMMTPTLNLGQIIYYQPEIIFDKAFPKKKVYKIEKFETTSPGAKGPPKISDIEIKSFKPLKRMKFRKKKRHSSVISKIEQIMNKNKGPLPIRDPSEESLASDYGIMYESAKGINDLPENILQKIFLHFNLQERNLLLAKVCKSWYYTLKDSMFWTELEFSSDRVKTQVIIELIKRYPSLRKLSLHGVPDGVEILQELCRCNQDLTHLTIKHCPISSQDFARIILHVISCCKDLEVLNLKGMQFQSNRYTMGVKIFEFCKNKYKKGTGEIGKLKGNAILTRIWMRRVAFFLELGRLKQLKSINLTGNKLLRTQDLITLSLNCRALQELRIYDINSDNKQGACLRNEDVALILNHLQRYLQTLKMDMQLLKNLSYQAIIKCSELRCLGMKNCLYLSSDVFQQFVELKNLRKLKVNRAINLKPEDFNLVFSHENMHKIEDLDLSGCWGVGEIGLQAITNRHHLLKYLSLKNCKSIKGYFLTQLSSCPDLIHLNIAHTEVEAVHLLSLSQHARKLQSLVIDTNMLKKSIIKQLKKQYPLLKLVVSCSEFKKCETLLTEF